MAQAIVQSSCTKLRSAIGHEATTGWNLSGELLEMVEALEAVKPLLHDAEKRSLRELDGEPEVREWVSRVRKNAYLISDMVDELEETRRTSPAAGKVTSILLPCLGLVRKKNQMADKMKQMIEELRKIVLDSGNFGFTPEEPRAHPVIDVPAAAVEEEKILGRDEEIKSLLAACDTSDGPVILPIDGQEGSGKTALARLVFNHTRFRHHSRVWVDVLQEYGLHNIGNSIISQLSGEDAIDHDGSSNQDYITKRIRELLNNSSAKVLVVLDGLHLQNEDCIQFKRMFGVGDKSSKVTVILTLRGHMERQFFTAQTIGLPLLSHDMCWTIIKQTSGFEGRPGSDREKLEQIGPEIAEKCCGSPRKAKAFGAMLRYKDATEWAEALNSYFWDDFAENILTPSFLKIVYSMMPSNLRLCYAYCAIFPKGHTIVKDCLIHQWIALRLIEPSDRFSSTQLAEEYIRSLVDLSLLQIMKPDSTSANDDKGSVVFTVNNVHLPIVKDLVRHFVEGLHDEFILLKGTSEPCYQQGYGRYAVLTDFDTGPLELSYLLPPQLRAIHSVGCSKMEFSDDSFSSTRWLRVLELKEHSMQKLPESVCQLRHLRCLNLSGCCGLVTLPDSFGDLLNLVYIDLSRCSKLQSLPKSTGKLTYLEHVCLSGCSALVTLPESLGKLINLVHINLSSCSSLVTLPESFGKLINLVHVGLSGCSGLVNLPRSFGKLIQLPHINLSGCSRLVSLPESFGELTNLLRVDLSGCSGLLRLPQSFGNLINLLYIDLSRCHALVDLPRSFRNLDKLQGLNLSFWSCYAVIRRALDGLTSLQHLDLSHPCSANAEHQPQHLQGLKEALGKLTKLQYLNLSMFFHSWSEEEIGGYMECISGLSSLEHLDLSQNMFLRDVPESLADLSKLHTLDLSGCIRLKTLPRRIYEMDCLKLIVLRHCRGLESYQFVVGADNGRGNLVQMEDVNCQEMEISSLEKVKSVEEARSIRLREKGHLVKLKLCWTLNSQRSMEDNALLGEVVPPHSLQCLELHGYCQGQSCLCAMPWWAPRICPNLLNLEEVTLESVWTCPQLPPLGLLPNLQRLVLRKIETVTRIDAGDLCFGNRPALRRLSKLTIDDMPNLQYFNTRYGVVDGGEDLMFPAVDELAVNNCPRFMFTPLPPRAQRLVLSKCDQVMFASWWTGGGRGVEGPPCTAAPVTELVVESCEVGLSDWNLLHHLDGLRSMTINNCRYLDFLLPAPLSSLQILCFSGCHWSMESLPLNLGDLNSLRELRIEARSLLKFPDSMHQLTSLESIHLSSCGLKQLPEWLGDLTSLQKLAIHNCYFLSSLPKSIGKLANLKDLHISHCSELKAWCEWEPNKKILAHIRPKYDNFVSSEQGTQSLQNEEPVGDTFNIGNGNGAGGDGSQPWPSSQHPSAGSIQMQPSTLAPSSRRPNDTQPPGSPQWDIYLT